jgi:hypothetical protein
MAQESSVVHHIEGIASHICYADWLVLFVYDQTTKQRLAGHFISPCSGHVLLHF